MTKVDLDALQSQAESFSNVASMVGESLSSVSAAVGGITGIDLSGAAATAAVSSAASKVKPLYKIASNVFKTVGNAISKLPDEYVAQVDGKSWSSEELEQKIQECETYIKKFESIEKKGKKEHASKGAKSAAKGAAKEIKAYEKKKEHYEKILRKLENFDIASAGFFEGTIAIIAPVMSFCSAIDKGYDSKSNKFTLPSKDKIEKWENSVVVTASKYGIGFMNGLKESHEKADQFVKHVMGKEDFSSKEDGFFEGKINKFKDKAWHAGRKLFGDTGKGENINTKELSGFKKAADFMENHPVAKKAGKYLGYVGAFMDATDFMKDVQKEGVKKAVVKTTASMAVQTSLQDVGSAVGAGIGTCIGGPVGTVVGEAIGGAAGSIAGSIISDKFINKD